MKTEKILLSISMLVSGQENMDKSLASLHFFKEALPCEIILVDTGCNAEGRALAEKVADQIIDFKWCDDFAAARNAGLKKCKGKWFLYLDDDEWFDNPQEIIHFFQSGEYKEYNSATYRVRNYLNRQGNIYEHVHVTRMIKRESVTEFRGKIHEYLYPCMPPQKTLTDFVHHFGYAYRNQDEKIAHAERNIKPLLEMVKDQPEEIRWQIQLAQEYFGIGRMEDTIDISTRTLEIWEARKEKNIYEYLYIGCAYGFILLALEVLEKYDKAYEWLEKALAEPNMPDSTRAFFYLMGTRIYGKGQKIEKCQTCTEKYLELYERLKDDTVTVDKETTLITATVFQVHNAFPSLALGIPTLILTENYDLIHRAFYTIDWSDKRMLGQNQHEKNMVESLCSVKSHPLWVEILQTLVSREGGMVEMYPVLLEKEIEYKTKGDREKLFRLRKLVSALDYPHKYIVYTKILWADEDPDMDSEKKRKDKLTQLFTQLFEKYSKELMEIRQEVWEVADRWQIDLEPMLQKVDFVTWKRELEWWVLEANLEDVQEWQGRIYAWKNKEDTRYKALNIKCTEGCLRNSKPPFYGIQEVEQLFWKCSDAILDLYRPCYTNSAFTDTPELLPDEIQFALQLRTLRQAREQGSDREVLEALRALNDTYEPMNGVIAYYAKLYREEVHNRNDEMAQLAAGLKRNVRILIGADKLDDAKAVITQLEQFIPGDEELQAFKDELQME